MLRPTASLAIALLIALASSNAAAQRAPGDETGFKLAKFGGQMDTMARACKISADLGTQKAKQKELAAQNFAVSAANFELHFAAGQAEAKQKIGAMSPQQLAQGCASLKQGGAK